MKKQRKPTRIYAVRRGQWHKNDDQVIHEGLLIAADGHFLGLGKGESIQALQDDLCVSDRNAARHAELRKRYPHGYLVHWCKDASHPGLQRAIRLLNARNPDSLDVPVVEAEAFVAEQHSEE